MKYVLRACLLGLIGWYFHPPVWAQTSTVGVPVSQDTIVVYDTLYVSDTIWLETALSPLPTRQHPFVQLDHLAGFPKKILFFNNRSATLLKNYIIDSVNNIVHFKNSDSMKKISFFGVVLLAFQEMVLAQNHITVHAGLGSYRMVTNTAMASKPGATFIGGLGYRRNLWANKLSVGCELNFHYMFRSDFDSLISTGQYAGFLNPLMYDADYTRRPYMFQMPIFFRWQTQWLSPSIGAEVYAKHIPKRIAEYGDTGQFEGYWRYGSNHIGASLTGGLDVPLSSRLLLGLNYFYGLTREESAGSHSGPVMESRMNRWELKARYRLF